MNYYELAEEEIQAIDVLHAAGQYRHAVYHSCVAIELLPKYTPIERIIVWTPGYKLYL